MAEGQIPAYCDVEYADEYMRGLLFRDSWTSANDDQKSAALITATRLIKQFSVFVFPDSDVPYKYDERKDFIPDWLKRANCEEALYLLNLARDPRFDKKLTLGIASTDGTVFSKDFTADILCLSCRTLIEDNEGEVFPAALGGTSRSVETGSVFK